MKQTFPEIEASLLLTDMVNFANKTVHMNPEQVRDFIIGYRRTLESLIMKMGDEAQYFEPAAGDATASVFERKGMESGDERSIRALRAALRIISGIEENKIPSTRIGLFSGKVIEARFNNQTFRFGNSFAAANRLQELCGYFGTSLLMDRDIASAQHDKKAYISSIGKITPKGFKHPIHLFTIHKPGINGLPHDIEEEKLFQYIKTKNEAMESFSGNILHEIKPDFPMANSKLNQAADLYEEIAGYHDIATERILEHIREHSFPAEDFLSNGMKIEDKGGNIWHGVKLFRLSQELLKALDREFYEAFILDTKWESCFKLEWRKKGEVIIEKDLEPDGIYFLTKGEVHILDAD